MWISALQVLYLDVYSIAVEKNASVYLLIIFGEDDKSWCWNLRFLSDFHE